MNPFLSISLNRKPHFHPFPPTWFDKSSIIAQRLLAQRMAQRMEQHSLHSFPIALWLEVYRLKEGTHWIYKATVTSPAGHHLWYGVVWCWGMLIFHVKV